MFTNPSTRAYSWPPFTGWVYVFFFPLYFPKGRGSAMAIDNLTWELHYFPVPMVLLPIDLRSVHSYMAIHTLTWELPYFPVSMILFPIGLRSVHSYLKVVQIDEDEPLTVTSWQTSYACLLVTWYVCSIRELGVVATCPELELWVRKQSWQSSMS